MTSALRLSNFLNRNRITLAIRVGFLSLLLLVVLYVAVSHLSGKYRLLLVVGELSCIPYKLVLVKMQRAEHIEFERGQILAFLPYGRLTDDLNQRLVDADGNILVVKYLAGLPGDLIEVKDDRVSVGGYDFGQLDLLEKLNAAPGSYDRAQLIAPGELAMMGTEKRSFDARYWGPINFDEVVGVVYPIW